MLVFTTFLLVALGALVSLSPFLIIFAWRRLFQGSQSAGVSAAGDATAQATETPPSQVGCLGCLLPLAIIFGLYIGSLQWGFHVQRQRNAAIAADVKVVVAGLASYARAHGGRYPAQEAFVAALRPHLPSQRMLTSPWSSDGAPLPVFALDEVPTDSGLSRKAWPGAAALAAGAPLPEIGVHLYGGVRGALIYDVTPDGRIYVVYGLGERSSPDSPFPLKTPKLIAAATNAR